MQIVRVQDAEGRILYGRRKGEQVLRIEGSLWDEEGFVITDEPVEVVDFLAPITPPNIFAIGKNYQAHAREMGSQAPADPIIFLKATTSLLDPAEPIVLPSCSSEIDYEGELAVIIGRETRDVPVDKAMECVFGYTCANDVTARDWQRRLGQWARAKSFDTFCPIGPWIETELPNPQALSLTTRVNGQVVQQANTSDMIFPIAQLISFLSQDLTLLAGTLILTGTPEGVGMGRTPPVWLKAGDQVSVSIEGVGELTNPVAGA
jgi:2-keto-4-pentenoate hydratase/2-oxohepta-3-ene-1,7-dioic acid hydratase in catechol pathway